MANEKGGSGAEAAEALRRAVVSTLIAVCAPLKGEPAGVADVELDLAPPSMGTGRSGGMRAEELNTSEQ